MPQPKTLKLYLLAHVNCAGTGIAQAKLKAKREDLAIARFTKLHPDRTVTAVGVRGAENPDVDWLRTEDELKARYR